MDLRVGGLIFSSNFDSGNLARVERVTPDLFEEQSSSPSNSSCKIGQVPKNAFSNNASGNVSIFDLRVDHEFKIWTRPDCSGTMFENGNRTWFHFSIRGYAPGKLLRITIMNLNKQSKIYSQGYAPIYRVCHPNQPFPRWQRIRDRPAWNTVEGQFLLTFLHRFSDLRGSTTFFAFCYPWTYSDTQAQLSYLETFFHNKTTSLQMSLNQLRHLADPSDVSESVLVGSEEISISDQLLDKVYFHRELLCYSLEGRRIDLITLTDWSGRLEFREDYFDPLLFPNRKQKRPWKFIGKKIVMITARVHPGETPSSHVFNGILEMLLRPNDARSCQLRHQYVFKLIPLLNPDGVFLGHYRTDTRGVNLNRVYLNPDFLYYPSIYACKALLVYHHTQYATNFPYAGFLDKVLHTISKQSGTEVCKCPGSPLTTQSFVMTMTDGSQSTVMEQQTTEMTETAPVWPNGETNCIALDPKAPVVFSTQDDPEIKRENFQASTGNVHSLWHSTFNLSLSQDEPDTGPEPVEDHGKLIPVPIDSDDVPTISTQTSGAVSSKVHTLSTDVAPCEEPNMTQSTHSVRENPPSRTELAVNQSYQPNKGATCTASYVNTRPKTHTAMLSTASTRSKRKASTKWMKTPRSISAVGYRLNAIRNSCKSSKLVVALRNRKSANAKMNCPPGIFTKWNAPLQQVIYSRAQTDSPKNESSSSKRGTEMRQITKLSQFPPNASMPPGNRTSFPTEIFEQIVGKSLEQVEFLAESESDFAPQTDLTQSYSAEVNGMKRSAAEFEPINYEALEVQSLDNQLILNESTRQHLRDDMYKISPMPSEPGNEGSDEDEAEAVQDWNQADQSDTVEDFSINPQFLRLTDWIKSFFDKGKEIDDENAKQSRVQELLNQLIQLRRGQHLAESDLRHIKPNSSGIAFYIDLHGHCSKRGCFLYGNWLESEDEMVDNVLYAVLVGVNSIHFDFNSCNFSLRNMYQKDRRGSLTKEGSGRVALWKHLGLIHCYTLECNYNTGPILNRLCRCLASAAPDESGRLTPPGSFAGPHWIDLAGSMGVPLHMIPATTQAVNGNTAVTHTSNIPMLCFPQRYTPAHFEEVGRALLCGMLDLGQTNPWPRIAALAGPNSAAGIGNITSVTGMPEFSHIRALREWVRKFVRGLSSSSVGGSHPTSSKPSSQRSLLNQPVASTDCSRSSDRNSVVGGGISQRPSRNGRNVNHSKLTPVSSGSLSNITTAPVSIFSNKTSPSILINSATRAKSINTGSLQRGLLNPVRTHRPQLTPTTGFGARGSSSRQNDLMGNGRNLPAKWTSGVDNEQIIKLGSKLLDGLNLDDHPYPTSKRPTQDTKSKPVPVDNTMNTSIASSEVKEVSEWNTSNSDPTRKINPKGLLGTLVNSKRNSNRGKNYIGTWKTAKLVVDSEGNETAGWSTAKQFTHNKNAPGKIVTQTPRAPNQKQFGDVASDTSSTLSNFKRAPRKPTNLAESILMNYVANSRQRRALTQITPGSARAVCSWSKNPRPPGSRNLVIHGESAPKANSAREKRTTRPDSPPQADNQHDSTVPLPTRPPGSSIRYPITDGLHLPNCLSMLSQSESPADAVTRLPSNHTPLSLPDLERTESRERSSSMFPKGHIRENQSHITESKNATTKPSAGMTNGLKKLWSSSGRNCGRLSQGKLKIVCTNHKIMGKSSAAKKVAITSDKLACRL
ncbi:CBPC5 [Fasciola gigantica]|uniref:CBPC5 n=1 Tax=Fasciola gigantica TaxID=46835 RepID=A0A504YPL4_FASGI|nr:CBPC5 [Fasciola gigantica]